jgi:uncharacterized protein (TIGR03382 family)
MLSLATAAASLAGCATEAPEDVWRSQSTLSADQRRERASQIRDAARARGLTNGVLLAGIADAETQMSQCWSELTWACQGPASPSCGGGPVVAGAGDGPCEIEQGGLGMFQFDGGTYAQTLARDGEAVLTTEGNVARAVDFVIDMVKRSEFIVPAVTTDEGALAWMNEVRPWNELFDPWIKTVTRYYNGCKPTSDCWANRYPRYAQHLTDIYNEFGDEFWYGDDFTCGEVPLEGATLDNDDACFAAGGPSQYWRTEAGVGEGGSLLWTMATDAATASNYATWRLGFIAEGEYLLEVSTTSTVATTNRATYEITHAGGTEIVTIDQAGKDGFIELGSFTFGLGAGQSVRVLDNTGEPGDQMKKIVVDALRLTRVDVEAPSGGGDEEGRPTASAGGCSTTPLTGWQSSAGSALWIGLILAAWLLRRRASRYAAYSGSTLSQTHGR